MICWGDPHFPSPTHYGSRNLKLGRSLSISSSSSSGTSEIQDSDHHFTEFKYQDLKKFTNNFTLKVGQGYFGSVFKGKLLSDSSSSVNIAVKRLHGVDPSENLHFLAEINTTRSINHINIVRLHGFCTDRSNRFLVYDYMPNGSLASHLFRNNNSSVKPVKTLTWEARYKIAIEIAKGIAYLHDECNIIHCDIKPDNVLLGSGLVVPKIASFGLAVRLHDLNRNLTTFRWTVGYIAPERFRGEGITSKVDVYSYGMLLFEIISGKRNSDGMLLFEIISGKRNSDTLLPSDDDVSGDFFPDQVSDKILKGEDLVELLDDKLKDVEVTQLRRAWRVACWCIQDEDTQRPTMSQVVQILEQHD